MSATSFGFVSSSRQTSSTGRPRSLPFVLTFSCQIWWASRAVLPFDARAPDSDRQYPILSGDVSMGALRVLCFVRQLPRQSGAGGAGCVERDLSASSEPFCARPIALQFSRHGQPCDRLGSCSDNTAD